MTCSRCKRKLRPEDTCLRAHPAEWCHKKCCQDEHAEVDRNG